ncbi:MAG: 30S ribosomal protein S6--L-glutamate ligase [Rickettsiales bacterium]|nr:30S ribosomal protein S6--L-glutamate ligase [Rickettsiales bacterium]
MENKTIIGAEEWVSFPSLNIPAVKARIDSGAKTSSLHAYNIEIKQVEGKNFAFFDIHPLQASKAVTIKCKAELVGERSVKSSSGHSEKRYVIKIPIKLGADVWEAEITLTNRDNMGYRMLLGREAMRGKLLVDPDKHFELGNYSDDQMGKFYNHIRRTDQKLKIVVLASNPELYSNKRIMEAGLQRGHEMIFVNIAQCYMNVSSNGSVHIRGGEAITDVDAVIPRIKPAMTAYGCSVLRHFETLGAYCLNDAISITRARDKLRALQLMVWKGINIPTTGFADSPTDTKDLIKIVGGAPLVIKLLEGTQGRGVVLAETSKAAESVINAFKSVNASILVQEFIKEAGGTDLRLFVVDGKIVGAMQRKAAEGEFRANVHLGASVMEIKPTLEERKMAKKAAKVLGLQVAGVDIIRSSKGPKILEVNSSPGLQGIEKATGVDIASTMIEAIEKKLL